MSTKIATENWNIQIKTPFFTKCFSLPKNYFISFDNFFLKMISI